MAALHMYTYIFFAVTSVGGGFGMTDEEFQSIDPVVAQIIGQLKEEIGKLNGRLETEIERNKEMEGILKTQDYKITNQDQEIRRLSTIVSRHESTLNLDNRKWKQEVLESDLVQNNTIEERVSLLEVQVADLREDVTEVDEDLTELEGDVNFLFDEQIIQDQRLFSLEQTNLQVAVELAEINVNILDLDTRVVDLEENGGGDGNSSIAELEVRVETLEGTTADHETRLTTAEADIDALETTISDQELRITSAEDNIQGLQTTDVNHDMRISDLEENGSISQNGLDDWTNKKDTIAFHSTLTSYPTIPDETAVAFNEVILNEAEGYDSTTGVFTVPPGGDGVYYFSTYMLGDDGEYGRFDMVLNDDVICSTILDHDDSGTSDCAPGSCSAVVHVVAGDEVQVVLRAFTDDTPLLASTTSLLNGFNGFRI